MSRVRDKADDNIPRQKASNTRRVANHSLPSSATRLSFAQISIDHGGTEYCGFGQNLTTRPTRDFRIYPSCPRVCSAPGGAFSRRFTAENDTDMTDEVSNIQ